MPLPRLRLAPGAGHGPTGGAWWPRCDALELELPALLGSLDPGAVTGVTRVTVGTAAWPDAPRTVMAPGHAIDVVLSDLPAGAHAITVDCGPAGLWNLLVIPPDERAEVAGRLLSAAATADRPPAADTGVAREGRLPDSA
ncbi:hypothetical protein WN71_023895 [Streptomyces mangrovisoli]|uniref:Uncharacterized protein n=2 Tax=Streptomyces mangrovisoli TaxID=1428628 RepID=A0A1J4NTI9_9ACTN|nr:hypothetical protein WN71_023895 [Streptomyces mangrovisoli]